MVCSSLLFSTSNARLLLLKSWSVILSHKPRDSPLDSCIYNSFICYLLSTPSFHCDFKIFCQLLLNGTLDNISSMPSITVVVKGTLFSQSLSLSLSSPTRFLFPNTLIFIGALFQLIWKKHYSDEMNRTYIHRVLSNKMAWWGSFPGRVSFHCFHK